MSTAAVMNDGKVVSAETNGSDSWEKPVASHALAVSNLRCSQLALLSQSCSSSFEVEGTNGNNNNLDIGRRVSCGLGYTSARHDAS
jgi:hypothetical protein